MATSKVPGAVRHPKVKSWLGNLFTSLSNKYLGTGLTGAEREAHDLNVAETMRQERRQEDFFNQYQSIGAQVRQMEDAGINPALAAGGISAGSPSSAPSASPASASPGADPIQAVLGTISGIRALKAQKQEIDNKQNEENRRQQQHDIEMKLKEKELSKRTFDEEHRQDVFNLEQSQREAAIAQAWANVDEKQANTRLIGVNIQLGELKKDYQTFMNALAEIDSKNRQRIIDSTLASADAQRLYLQSEKELVDLRAQYAKEDREDEKAILKARLEEAEAQADYMKKRKEKNQEIVDAEVKALKGDARYSAHHFGLDLAGKISTGIGVLGGTALGAWKILGNAASKAVTPLATDLWIDSHNPATITGSILN